MRIFGTLRPFLALVCKKILYILQCLTNGTVCVIGMWKILILVKLRKAYLRFSVNYFPNLPTNTKIGQSIIWTSSERI